jgi:hypothetical protein
MVAAYLGYRMPMFYGRFPESMKASPCPLRKGPHLYNDTKRKQEYLF